MGFVIACKTNCTKLLIVNFLSWVGSQPSICTCFCIELGYQLFCSLLILCSIILYNRICVNCCDYNVTCQTSYLGHCIRYLSPEEQNSIGIKASTLAYCELQGKQIILKRRQLNMEDRSTNHLFLMAPIMIIKRL